MLKKLRRKFIIMTMISLTVVLAIILGGIMTLSYHKLTSDADDLLIMLSSNHGSFPEKKEIEPRRDFPRFNRGGDIYPETPYETRFFTVFLAEDGEVDSVDLGRVASVDETTAREYASQILKKSKTKGFIKHYRYIYNKTEGESIIVFMDCYRNLATHRNTVLISVIISSIGLLMVFVLLTIFSQRIIKPVAESYEKQKRFITDAGHELKTPLTIINADSDLLTIDYGENEWLDDIRVQTKKLTNLTNDLVYLARMDEEHTKVAFLDFSLSDVVEDVASSFSGLAISQNKELNSRIEPMISFCGDEKAIRQLVSILLDNAIKYSPEETMIELSLLKDAKGVRLVVSNESEMELEKESLSMLFERFYRSEKSRNSDTGGYGLGLSIAQSVVNAHKGKIKAEIVDKNVDHKRLSISCYFKNPAHDKKS